jgi:transcriptional regulator with XRE-family HTH domain
MTEIGKEKTTFSSRLKEKRIEKGWSQYYLAARAGCTNSNISYLEKHPEQKPKLETVEGIAAALDWPINEARRLAGYPESDDNLSPLEVEDDFRLALHGYKGLSENGRELIKKQIIQLIDFVSKCEQRTSGEVTDIKLDKLDKQTANKGQNK